MNIMETAKKMLAHVVLKLINLKILRQICLRSKTIQRLVLEALATKSRLTEKDALELGEKIKEGMLQELRQKGLI
jgi:hypothetical protein